MSGVAKTFFVIGVGLLAFAVEDVTNNSSPNIISRAEWGARPRRGSPEELTQNPPPYVVIHHSDTVGCTTQAICQARVRSIQNYHMDSKDWEDIGYNFLVGEDGNVYEGRGWGIRGAHSVKFNAKSIGICIIGNFTQRIPEPAAVNAAQNLITYGVANNKIMNNYTLLGHRQTAATDCPGSSLYDLIKSWPGWSSIP